MYTSLSHPYAFKRHGLLRFVSVPSDYSLAQNGTRRLWYDWVERKLLGSHLPYSY